MGRLLCLWTDFITHRELDMKHKHSYTLLPCSLCGSTDIEFITQQMDSDSCPEYYLEHNMFESYYLECSCGMSTPAFRRLERVVHTWNYQQRAIKMRD
jgi:hypothetical protein